MNTTNDIGLQDILNGVRAGLEREGFMTTGAPVPPVAPTTPVVPPVAPPVTPSAFQEQLNATQAEHIGKMMDPAAGAANMQQKRGRAAAKSGMKVEFARRIARTLAQNGPITVDDVTAELIKQHHDTTARVDPAKRRFWKGSIFTTGEWVCVGEAPSRIRTNNARPVKAWALKSWLQQHSLNGSHHYVSAFNTLRICEEFQRQNKGVLLPHCNWYIGAAKLSDETATAIKAGKMTLYGAPVTLIPNAVGALLQLPVPYVGGQPQSPTPDVRPTTLEPDGATNG